MGAEKGARAVVNALPPWTEVERAWLAGLIEGEGYFGVTSNGRYVYQRVGVKMTDRDVIERVAKLFGGVAVQHRPAKVENHFDQWCAEARGTRAVAIMRAILPHMGFRRSRQIKELIP